MTKSQEFRELENAFIRVIAQLELLSELLRDNRDVESFAISAMLEDICNNCPPLGYMTFAHNEADQEAADMRAAIAARRGLRHD